MDDEGGEAIPDVRVVLDTVRLGQQRGHTDVFLEPGASTDDAGGALPEAEGVGQGGGLRNLPVEKDPLLGHEDVVEDDPRVHLVEPARKRVVCKVRVGERRPAVHVQTLCRDRHGEVHDLVR